jgi:hypothetical protein
VPPRGQSRRRIGATWGLDAKRRLLALEKVPLAALTQQSMLEFRALNG